MTRLQANVRPRSVLCPHCGRASETVKERQTREGIYDQPFDEEFWFSAIRVELRL
jgi:hypothetical protein